MADTRLKRVAGQYLAVVERRNLTASYTVYIRHTIREFAAWCEGREITAATKMSAQDLTAYMAQWEDQGGSSQRKRWGVVRAFLSWAGCPTVLEYRYRARGPDRFNVRWLTSEQVHRLLEASLKPLERLQVSLGLYAGLRMREALDLRVVEAENALRTRWLTVRGKGYKSRAVYLHDALKGALTDYLRTVDLAPTARLIPMSPQVYDRHLRVVGGRLGFPLSSHDLRRTHAAKLCEGDGLDVACISLGHADTSVTVRYAGAQMVRLQKAITALDYTSGVQTPTEPVI